MVSSCKCGYEHHQCRFRQMEVCNQPVHHLELVARIDKDIRVAAAGFHMSVRFRSALYSTTARRTDTNHTVSGCFGMVDFIRRFLGHLIKFCVHMVFQHVVDLDRTECAKSHMQRDIGNIHTHRFYLGKQLLCKMQSCRRRSCRAFKFCIYRLITVFVLKLMGNIGRQRHFTEGIQHLFPDPIIKKLHQAISIFLHIQNLCTQTSVAKDDLCTGAQLFAGLYEGFPDIVFHPL